MGRCGNSQTLSATLRKSLSALVGTFLWRGDKALGKRWWPQIKALLALHDKFDSDGDDLEDRANTPYPEQPDPGTYNHEMLYVQCFWRQAFAKAACVAEWLGEADAPQFAQKAKHISAAIEKVFGTDYGLAVWVDKNHNRTRISGTSRS